MTKLPHWTGIPDGVYGARYSWRSPDSEGVMIFDVKEALPGAEGWVLNCVDGNGREFTATGETHAETMYRAMGIAMGLPGFERTDAV